MARPRGKSEAMQSFPTLCDGKNCTIVKFCPTFVIASSMILGFQDLQVGQDSTVVTSFCVQLAVRRARGLWTDVDW